MPPSQQHLISIAMLLPDFKRRQHAILTKRLVQSIMGWLIKHGAETRLIKMSISKLLAISDYVTLYQKFEAAILASK